MCWGVWRTVALYDYGCPARISIGTFYLASMLMILLECTDMNLQMNADGPVIRVHAKTADLAAAKLTTALQKDYTLAWSIM